MQTNNLIIIGGPISSGKSTLAKKLPFPSIVEIDDCNKIQKIIIEQTYAKKRVHSEVIEFYFLEARKNKYKYFSQKLTTHILDRSIFESLWFAKENLSINSFQTFKKIFINYIKYLIKEYGKPKLYILLDINWKNFYKRIFMRKRIEEIKYFKKNEMFFKKHIKFYVQNMKEIFQKYDLNYVVIDTNNLTIEKVYLTAWKFIKELENEKK